jgi:hypothetical protein
LHATAAAQNPARVPNVCRSTFRQLICRISVLSIDFAALPARTTTGMTKRQNRDAGGENIPDVNSEAHRSNSLSSTTQLFGNSRFSVSLNADSCEGARL